MVKWKHFYFGFNIVTFSIRTLVIFKRNLAHHPLIFILNLKINHYNCVDDMQHFLFYYEYVQ